MRLYDCNPTNGGDTIYCYKIQKEGVPDLAPRDSMVVCGADPDTHEWYTYIKVYSSVGDGIIGMYPSSFVGAGTNFSVTGYGWLEWKVVLEDLGALTEKFLTTVYVHPLDANPGGDNPISDLYYDPKQFLRVGTE